MISKPTDIKISGNNDEEFVQDSSFLGTGWSFPPTFSRYWKGVELVEAADDIRESLYIILTTNLGERVMQPNFGCGLDEFVFESVTENLKTNIKDKIKKAILFFEPRITVEAIVIDWSQKFEQCLEIDLQYIIRTTNSRTNLVFPFYLDEN